MSGRTTKTSKFEILKIMLTYMRERKQLIVLIIRIITAILYGYACILVLTDIFASARGIVTTIFSCFVALLLIGLGVLLVIKITSVLISATILLPIGYLIAWYFGATFSQYISFIPFIIAFIIVGVALKQAPLSKEDLQLQEEGTRKKKAAEEYERMIIRDYIDKHRESKN